MDQQRVDESLAALRQVREVVLFASRLNIVPPQHRAQTALEMLKGIEKGDGFEQPPKTQEAKTVLGFLAMGMLPSPEKCETAHQEIVGVMDQLRDVDSHTLRSRFREAAH
jgi:hypothetical protein